MATKKALELAREAGLDCARTEPPERTGVEACPFNPVENPEEREAWLGGLKEGLTEGRDTATVVKEIDDELASSKKGGGR